MRDAVTIVEAEAVGEGDDDADEVETFRSFEEDGPDGGDSNPRSTTIGRTTLGSTPRGWISDARYWSKCMP